LGIKTFDVHQSIINCQVSFSGFSAVVAVKKGTKKGMVLFRLVFREFFVLWNENNFAPEVSESVLCFGWIEKDKIQIHSELRSRE
jgi:hypothetical protein